MDNQNENKEPILLTAGEKYVETQKQDWQIEALIVGSIIIGLTQVPGLMRENFGYFADYFGNETTALIQSIITNPFIILLYHLSLVLYYRIMWVIKFIEKDFIDYQRFDSIAGILMARGLKLFIILIIGCLFYISIIYILQFFYNNDLIFGVFLSYYLIFQASFIASLYFVSIFESKYIKKIINFYKYLINPISYFIPTIKKLDLLLNLTTNKELNFSQIFSKILTLVFIFFMMIIYPLFFNSKTLDMNKIINYNIENRIGNITIENDVFEKENLWIFIKSNKLPFTIIVDEYGVKSKKSDVDHLKLLINNKIQNKKIWTQCYTKDEYGVKTFLNRSDFEKGFNKMSVVGKNLGYHAGTDTISIDIYNP
jgi:hypothetical protein